MKIVIISTRDIAGGAARAAYRLKTLLKDRGIDVKMYVASKMSNDSDVCLLDIRESNRFSKLVHKVYLRVLSKLSNINECKRSAEKLQCNPSQGHLIDLFGGKNGKTLFQDATFDILNIHWVDGFINWNHLRKFNRPIVLTMHDCLPFTGGCHHFWNCRGFMTNCATSDCPLVGVNGYQYATSAYVTKKQKFIQSNMGNICAIAPSNWLASCARKSYFFQDIPIHVIPNGLDTSLFQPSDKNTTRLSLGLSLEKKYLLFGACNALTDPIKGFDKLIKALGYYIQHYTNKIELIIFGATQENLDVDIELPITFVGFINNDELLARYYAAVDVMLVPSMYENLCQTAIEALACGTPVVAFATSGLIDIVDHQKNGYLATCYDCADYAQGIAWCLNNNDNAILSQNARQKVMTTFANEAVAQKYIDLYQIMLNKV